jgi:hypothetical protein
MVYQIEFLKGAQVVERLGAHFTDARTARDHAITLMRTESRLHNTAKFRIRTDGGAIVARWPEA